MRDGGIEALAIQEMTAERKRLEYMIDRLSSSDVIGREHIAYRIDRLDDAIHALREPDLPLDLLADLVAAATYPASGVRGFRSELA